MHANVSTLHLMMKVSSLHNHDLLSSTFLSYVLTQTLCVQASSWLHALPCQVVLVYTIWSSIQFHADFMTVLHLA